MRLYSAAGLVAIVWAAVTYPKDAVVASVWFFLAVMLLSGFTVKLGAGFIFPASEPLTMAAMLALPIQAPIIIEALAILVLTTQGRLRPIHLPFNVANSVLPTIAGIWVYRLFEPDWHLPMSAPLGLAAAAVGIGIRFMVNLIVIHLSMAADGECEVDEWRTALAVGWPLGFQAIAILIACAFPTGGPYVLLAAMVLLISLHKSTEFYAQKETLINAANLDGLTEVRNRRSWEAEAERLKTAPLGHTVMVMVDLDSLKALNDTAGHLEGDRAIREMAAMLSMAAGGADRVYRYGGDEFVVLLPSATATDSTARRVIDAAERFGEDWKVQGVRVSASVGVASSPTDGKTLEELFRVADDHMYSVKRLRRARQQELNG